MPQPLPRVDCRACAHFVVTGNNTIVGRCPHYPSVWNMLMARCLDHFAEREGGPIPVPEVLKGVYP